MSSDTHRGTIGSRARVRKIGAVVTALVIVLVVVPLVATYGLIRQGEDQSPPTTASEVGLLSKQVTLTEAPNGTKPVERKKPEYQIIGLLPRDALPAVFFPHFDTVEQIEATQSYKDEELVIALSIDNDHRAYSVPYLAGREVVNDTVGGVPVAVTW